MTASILSPLSNLSPEQWHRAFALRYNTRFHCEPFDGGLLVMSRDWTPLFFGPPEECFAFMCAQPIPARTQPRPIEPQLDLDISDLLDGLL